MTRPSVVELLAASRAASGVPPTVEDEATLRRIVGLFLDVQMDAPHMEQGPDSGQLDGAA